MTPTTEKHKTPAPLAYFATYGGIQGIAPLYGTLQRLDGQLVFLTDDDTLVFPTPEEWYLYGMVHGEVGLVGSQAVIDACRARVERQQLEATNLLPRTAA